MKKEGIFIIDPTLDRKLSTLPPVYIPPPFATSRISPLDTPDVNIKQVVNELAMVTLIPSQNSGFFIFSVWNSPLKELLYRIIWCSRPVLMSLIQALVTVGLGLFVLEYPDIVYAFLTSRSQTGKENGTMSVTEVVLNGTILVSDIVGSIIFIRERERIQQFMNKLQSSITSLAEEVRDAPWLAEWFETTITNTRRLVNSINVAVIPTTLVLCWPQLCAIYGALLGGTWEYLDFIVWSFPLFSLGWCLTLFRRLHFRVLIMSTIDCLQFGFRCIREQVQQIGSEMEAASSPIPRGDFQVIRRKVPEMDNQDDLGTEDQKGHLGRHSLEAYLREARLNAILDKYRTMELLLQEFNELFAPHLLIGVVSIVVVILLSIFHLYVEITPHQSVKAVFYGVTTFVYILVMYLLGSAATEMASQVVILNYIWLTFFLLINFLKCVHKIKCCFVLFFQGGFMHHCAKGGAADVHKASSETKGEFKQLFDLTRT